MTTESLKMRQMTLRKYGIIDLDGLYKAVYRWFYDEKMYFEEPLSRVRPGTAAGKEYEYRWTGWRKINDYAKQNIRIQTHVWDAKDIEVVRDGHKIRLTKCRIRIEFNGEVEVDYKKSDGSTIFKGKFGSILGKMYNTFILQEERQLANWWDELYYRLFKLHTICKEYLDMEAKGNAYYDVW